MRTSVGDWTRPTERKAFPYRFVARETQRVNVAPQIRSISCRASPAAASSLETSTRLSNARVTSPLVSAEKRERSTWSMSLGLASNASDNASTPMSSPSRSKSVAITTLSAFLERERTASATPFSETDFRISASIRLEGSTFCQLEYSSGYSTLITCPLRPTETHSSPFQVKVWCGMLRCLPSLTDPSARNQAIFFAAFAFSEIISRILLRFYTDKTQFVGRKQTFVLRGDSVRPGGHLVFVSIQGCYLSPLLNLKLSTLWPGP